MSKHILIVEDDSDLANLVALHLQDLSFETTVYGDGKAGLDAALAGDHALIVLDLMLPSMDGFDVCREVRRVKPTLPILMLTAKNEELDRVLGLELGADDYVTKPFSVRELGARVKAILRRTSAAESSPAAVAAAAGEVIDVSDLSIDLAKRRVRRSGNEVELTAKEFDLLVLFASNPGKVFSRNELLDKVWGYQYEGYGHTVNSHINRLRAKVEPQPSDPTLITTVWGVGYRFVDGDEETAS